MDKLIIKNGLIFDPVNKIEGEIIDILIEDGKIVDKHSSQSDIKEIDAKGKTVIPAAVDIHCHVASQQLNFSRLLGTNNKKFQATWNGLTLNNIAQDYISNGYTLILEANVFPSLSKTTVFDFKNIPILDKAMLINVSNLWPLELEFQRGKIEDIAIFIQDLLRKVKGFGIKVYNPFENEFDWNYSSYREDLSKSGRLFNFNALDVYENITKCVEFLGLPHSSHAHIEGYETEQAKTNLISVLKRINSSDIKKNNRLSRNQIFHIAHASAYNIDGDNTELIKIVNQTNKFDLDLGFLTFNDINPLITSDKRLIEKENKGNGNHLIREAIEFEGDTFIIFREFNKKNRIHAIIWANALELALKIEDKWKVQLNVNFPNYGNIIDIPKIASWLMSTDARNNFIDSLDSNFPSKAFLQSVSNYLTFNDFVIISRASPAKSLGMGKSKGNLGFGADGDLNILNININEIGKMLGGWIKETKG